MNGNQLRIALRKKLASWVGKLLSYGDRLILINTILTSFPMFMLSFFEIPIGVQKRLDFFRSRFFWQSDGHKRKYRLTKWDILCRPKDQGGLGIEVLKLKNRCLLSKWLFKLLTEEGGVWQELINNKYLITKSLSQVQSKPTDSPFWKGILKGKDDFFDRGSFTLGNGKSIRFWEDTWLGDKPLSKEYPSLYNIVYRKQVLVADVLGSAPPPNIGFRRALTGNKWDKWLHLVNRLMHVQLSGHKDLFRWNLTVNGMFTVKSLYLDFMSGHTKFLRKYLWKMKVPLKIKIFMWFLYRREILTKDNLAKRNWNGCNKCCFCDQEETIHHLFITCPLARMVWRIVHMAFGLQAPNNITSLFGNWLKGVSKSEKIQIRVGVCALLWAVWNVRNDYIFNRAKKTSFMQVIPLATHWIRTWFFLQSTEKRDAMDFGCSRLELVDSDLFAQFSWRYDLRITW